MRTLQAKQVEIFPNILTKQSFLIWFSPDRDSVLGYALSKHLVVVLKFTPFGGEKRRVKTGTQKCA